MADDELSRYGYGFIWGNMEVTRMIVTPEGGHVLNVKTEGKSYRDGVEIYLSPKGRSIRVWRNGKELT